MKTENFLVNARFGQAIDTKIKQNRGLTHVSWHMTRRADLLRRVISVGRSSAARFEEKLFVRFGRFSGHNFFPCRQILFILQRRGDFIYI